MVTVPTPSRSLAFAQLVRLPNVFTAFADVLLGASATGLVTADPVAVLLLCLASAGLYLGGMAWNDYFDRHDDAKVRPFRPVPSGRVSPRAAGLVAAGLSAVGLLAALAATVWHPPPDGVVPPVAVAALLSGLIVLYDAVLKHTPAGPWAMGACRALNVCLGLSATGVLSAELTLHLALAVGVYIAGVTLFARTEEGTSRRRPLVIAAGVMAASAVGTALLPIHDPAALGFRPYPYLVAAWAAWVGTSVARALKEPGPKEVQAAVKRCIFGLVPLDALLATAFVGWPGLVILVLFLPARWLGRRVYST